MQGLQETFATNSLGPLLMAKYFAPLLTKGGGGFGVQHSDKKQQHSAVLVNMSAKVGSITDNGEYTHLPVCSNLELTSGISFFFSKFVTMDILQDWV